MEASSDKPEGAPGSPLTRALTSPITQAIGIIGVALEIFQGLEPFLRFSRLVAWFVEHWRELTREIWLWAAQILELRPPDILLDMMSLFTFLTLFTVRSFLSSHTPAWPFDRIAFILLLWPRWLEDAKQERRWAYNFLLDVVEVVILPFSIALVFLSVAIVPVSVAVVLYPHAASLGELYPYGAAIGVIVFAVIFAFVGYVLLVRYDVRPHVVSRMARHSALAVVVLLVLLIINWISLYSHDIEEWLRAVTE